MTVILAARSTDTFLGVCDPCRRPVRARDEQAPGRYARLSCPQCGKIVTGERLHATINADPCHGRCMGATGPACSCSCGGANHGRLWEYHSEETETALTAYRARLAEQQAAAQRRADAAAQRRRAVFQAWADEHPEVIEFLGDGSRFDIIGDDRNDFLYDMARNVNRHRILTEHQAAAVIRCRDARRRIDARRAEEQANARPVPTGDAVSITGTIIYTDIKDNPYGPGARYVMLIKGEGWKVWSTVPASLRGAAHRLSDLKGRRVQLTAAIQAKPGDPHEGNAKRPRNATLIDTAESSS